MACLGAPYWAASSSAASGHLVAARGRELGLGDAREHALGGRGCGKRTRAPTACASTPRRRRRSTARSRRPRRLTLAERDNRNEFRLLEPRRARPRERRAARCRSRPSGRKARRLRGAERGGTPRRRVTSRHGAARAFCDTKIHDKHLAAPIRSDLVVPFLNRAQQRTRCGRRHPLRAHGDVAHAQPRA